MRKFFVRRFTYQENFASSYSQIWANSIFTSGFIFKYWKKKSRLIFPPHSERHFSSTTRNSYDILSIGRFMNPRDGHCKNQLKLVEAFEKLTSKSPLPWKLHLAGGVDSADDRYFKKVSDLVKSKGLNVSLYPNCLQSDLDYLLQSSQFYWHATGMGVTRNRPEDMEHFGIAIVEALNAGLIPIVYDVAGPSEILGDYPLHRFTSINDLVNKTRALSESNLFELREKFKETAMKYNNMNFQSRVDAALLDLGFILDKRRS
jgi:glycosyltransferase involved in cell wall biosynthesis